MSALPRVYMINKVPELPNSLAYPKEEMVARFGPWFFTSTLSWMFALAISQGPEEIALYGVDMSATSEWVYQRSGCHFFIDLAKKLGIKVTTPFESDLLRPPPLYGYCEEDPYNIKMMARKEELQARLNDAIRREAAAHDERLFIQGAIDDIEYTLKTWISDRQAIDMAYAQPAWAVQQSIPVGITEPADSMEIRVVPDPEPPVPAKAVRKRVRKPAAKQEATQERKRGRPKGSKNVNGAVSRA